MENEDTKDPRFKFPVEFVKKHVMGCFEASKACAILPGKPHLYHAEFLQRSEEVTKVFSGSNVPIDFYTEIKYSTCDEVSWYLSTCKDLTVYERQEKADKEFVINNLEGFIKKPIKPLTDKEIAEWKLDAIEGEVKRALDKQSVYQSVYTTLDMMEKLRKNFGMPTRISQDSTTDTKETK
jgi:hypothetical protein